MLTRELVVHLIDPEEAIGERGYYVASLEAAMQHVLNLRVGKHSYLLRTVRMHTYADF